LGPAAGVPLPSTTVALWIRSRWTRRPLVGAGACAKATAAVKKTTSERSII